MEQGGFAFDMTVIVPVYNAVSYVERCVLSLDAQRVRKTSFEVILVDDGSTDGSGEVCDAMVAKRPNFTCIHQRNRGVSLARNAGIRNAKGRYITFLDGDDTISSTSVEHLAAAFDRFGEAVDLLTYPLRYIDTLDGYEHTNARYKWLKATRVYDLSVCPFVAQTSVNVCVRNLGDETPLFNQEYSHSEDQLFNTLVLSKKHAIGFCARALYRYYRVPTSVTMLHDMPQTSFDDVMSVFEEYLRLAREDARFARYAYALVLYNVGWRMRERKLIPSFGDEEDRERNHQRLAKVLQDIPKESWFESPYVSSGVRNFLATSYDLDWSKEVEPVAIGTIDWMTLQDNILAVRGLVQIPRGLDGAAPCLRVDVGGTKDMQSMVPGSAGCWRFEVALPIAKGCQQVIRFYVEDVAGKPLPLDFRLDLVRTNGGAISAHVRLFGKTVVSFGGNTLYLGSIRGVPQWATPIALRLAYLKDRSYALPSARRIERMLRLRVSRGADKDSAQRLWVYIDSFTDSRHGLAYRLFERDAQRDDGITRAYLTKDQDPLDRIALFMRAERVFSSSTTPTAPYPCGMRLWSRIADLGRSQTFTLVSSAQTSLEGTCYDDVYVL